jgi:Domain of unknown function (DUF6475)
MEATNVKDEIKFKEYLAMLCELHDRTMSKMLTDLYWKVLEPFTNEQCEDAFKELIYSSKYFPKPSDFMDIMRGKKESRAIQAWMDAVNAVRKVGNYQSVTFADNVIHSVIVQMGGWVQLCTMTTEDEKWKQKEFERLYNILSEFPRAAHITYLPGTLEIDNNARGYEYRGDVVKIGFGRDKIKLIQEG